MLSLAATTPDALLNWHGGRRPSAVVSHSGATSNPRLRSASCACPQRHPRCAVHGLFSGTTSRHMSATHVLRGDRARRVRGHESSAAPPLNIAAHTCPRRCSQPCCVLGVEGRRDGPRADEDAIYAGVGGGGGGTRMFGLVAARAGCWRRSIALASAAVSVKLYALPRASYYTELMIQYIV